MRLTMLWRARSSQPVRYITHVLGHEGPGSLTEFLRTKGALVHPMPRLG